ncbi:hypothetical protein ER308_18440 [Egibacter rhizosphaerae]|uniref:Uncharacterized protein n=1 Tax=Egibacter rhizosphaerae TaxID=1670831 RepID=A0A411YJL2_9ACTN|nr:hypothetical protein [Egibacter rhizosphaerae]QBI21349.1 hypothetical protein ER308_18440 [Egibacter rhizosphaerae]
MYRDDACAVCGESLPPDHFYCREHAAGVDDRLHEVGRLLARLADDVPRLAERLAEVAPETWDWLADEEERAADADDEEVVWPPTAPLRLRAHHDEVEVVEDDEPGMVRLSIACDLATLLEGLARGLDEGRAHRLARACAEAEGGNVTH